MVRRQFWRRIASSRSATAELRRVARRAGTPTGQAATRAYRRAPRYELRDRPLPVLLARLVRAGTPSPNACARRRGLETRSAGKLADHHGVHGGLELPAAAAS